MRKTIIAALLALTALMCACKEEPVTPTETGASYVRTAGTASEVWYFDNSDSKLFEHYDLQGSIKIPYDNGWWKLEDGVLSLTCRGAWSMYSAPTENGIRLDIGGNSFEMRGGDGQWQYSDGYLTCTLTVENRGGDNPFSLVLADSWHTVTYSGTCGEFKGIDTVYNADSKTDIHLNVSMNENVLEIDGNRFSRM